MNVVFVALVVVAFVFAAFTGRMAEVSDAVVGSAQTAVTLSIGLVGIMALWLGLMRVAQEAGLVALLARIVRPVMRPLFPDLPPDHPAMASMVMNMAANMLGLGNAATPLGLKAMQDLQDANPDKETATDAMVMFLCINTASVQIVPATVIALRAAAHADQPGDIILPTLIATTVSTLVAVVAALSMSRLRRFRLPAVPADE